MKKIGIERKEIYCRQDNIDIRLLNSDGTIAASSASSRNNVEIIEYTTPSDGSYSIQAVAEKVCDTTNGECYFLFVGWLFKRKLI